MATPRSPQGQTMTSESEVHYTTFIRLPFPRGEFVDPPLVDWNRSKEKALWKILSRAPRSADLDWKDLANKFEVTLPFILQQAAWMYERQLSQMREQMRKASQQSKAQGSSQNVERTQSSGIGGLPMQRQGSSDTSRPRSFVETDNPLPGSSGATPKVGSSTSREHPFIAGNVKAPPLSRNTSQNTITQSRRVQPSSPARQNFSQVPSPLQRSPRLANAVMVGTSAGGASEHKSPSSSDSSDSDNDSSSSERTGSKILGKSQMFRRAPRYVTNRKNAAKRISKTFGYNAVEEEQGEKNNDDYEEEDDRPTFVTPPGGGNKRKQDLGATLRNDSQQQASRAGTTTRGVTQILSRANTDSSVSSATSSAAPLALPADAGQSKRRSLGALSPRQQAELAKLSPRGKYLGKEGSEGTPSMGSSFSDLDDTSVTQSALEEALNSNMQRGVGSRMSTMSQASRSRF